MPFKRVAPTDEPLSSPPSPVPNEDNEPVAKRAKLAESASSLRNVKVYIIQAKLSTFRIAELVSLAEKHTKLCREIDDADVIVTAISMRRRLERHMPWEVATQKAIVTPEWLIDSVNAGHPLPCEDYVAVADLYDSTSAHCPDCKKFPCECSDTDHGSMRSRSQSIYPSPPSSPKKQAVLKQTTLDLKKREPAPSVPIPVSAGTAPPTPSISIPAHLLPPPEPIPTKLPPLSYLSKYACQRASPLICPNQELAEELDIIKRSRTLEGEERSALSYERAISIIKAYPHRFKSKSEAEKLPFIGTKISGLIEEFLDTGKITEAREIASSERFKTLSDFAAIYGIGPNTARKLYNLELRTVEHLEVYYGVDPSEIEQGLMEMEKRETHQGWKGRNEVQRDDLGESWIKVALGLRHDLAKKIPRDEVEEMHRVVMHELNAIEPGCVSTIVGGHRRGKPESNDVDIVFTHPDPQKVKGLVKRLVKRLYGQGMVSHVMHLSGFHGHNPLRTAHWDSLEKALTVFTLPKSSSFDTGTRRRLDLIFAQPNVYWPAVIGWSGSIMFQRDLRQWAKDKCGMKFDSSGITRRHDSKPLYPKTEKEVFDLFGLDWIDPTMRNADV